MNKPGRPRKIYDGIETKEIDFVDNEVESQNPDQPLEGEIYKDLNIVSDKWIEPVNEIIPATIDVTKEMSELTKSPHNWQPINTASRNGMPVKLTDDPSKEGIIAFWRKSRAFANATHRWTETGFWTDSITGKNIDFNPLWWKDRNV